jgi:hypothetical protein
MYCWLNPESSAKVLLRKALLPPDLLDVPPNQLAHVHTQRSADNDAAVVPEPPAG